MYADTEYFCELLQWSRRRSLRSYTTGTSALTHNMQASMEPQAIPAELRLRRNLRLWSVTRFNGAAGDPCGVTRPYNHDGCGMAVGFNGAAGDPCGVTQYTNESWGGLQASMEPQAIPAELRGALTT